jgi:NodT family efflux transporter outer membrane factor (OMF) lipoprotein
MRAGRGTTGGALKIAVAGAAIVSGCTVGPDYRRPDAPVPAFYKEAGWKVGEPLDVIDRGAWWSVYKDPVLDDLERQVDISNQNLKAAEAAFQQAEWIVAQARAGFFPIVDLNATAQRSRGSGGFGIRSNNPLTTSTGSGATGTTGTVASGGATAIGSGGGAGSGNIGNLFSTSASASWVPDLWGRIRRTVEGDVASAQASAGDLASARLSAHGTLASNYLQLRVADELKRLLDAAAAAYAESLRITRNQYQAGTTDQSAVSQAEAQLESTRAQAIAVGVTRAQLEHAIAVLIGKPPAEFSIASTEAVIEVPVVPAGVPSALLERRPDIAAAERLMASANAQIGVAEAAFYPDITLSAAYGVSSFMLGNLFSQSARIWSFGSNLVQTIFDAGARSAQVEQTRQLAALRILAQQAEVQQKAVSAAREAERIITNQYLAGTVAYTSVVVAQTTALADAETAVNIRQSRLVASAALIQALGGGWDVSQLPSRERIEENAPLNFSPFPPAERVQAR